MYCKFKCRRYQMVFKRYEVKKNPQPPPKKRRKKLVNFRLFFYITHFSLCFTFHSNMFCNTKKTGNIFCRRWKMPLIYWQKMSSMISAFYNAGIPHVQKIRCWLMQLIIICRKKSHINILSLLKKRFFLFLLLNNQ